MDYLGESVLDFHCESRRKSEEDLRAGACGDGPFDSADESYRGSKVELQRNSQRHSDGDSRGDSDGALQAESLGRCAREPRIRG